MLFLNKAYLNIFYQEFLTSYFFSIISFKIFIC